jgi:hypothetical protein
MSRALRSFAGVWEGRGFIALDASCVEVYLREICDLRTKTI